jgi:hypothetical protein
MNAFHEASPNRDGPSVHECIEALRDNRQHLEHTADFPQNGIYQRFGEAFTMATAFAESEVRRCFDAAIMFVRETPKGQDDNSLQARYSATMRDMQEVLLRYCKSPPPLLSHGDDVDLKSKTGEIVKASQEMAMARSPTKRSLEMYRKIIAQKARAANGELISLYGKKGDPVPPCLGTICAEDVDDDPLVRLIINWLMDPFLELITNPFRSILPNLPIVGRRFKDIDPEQKLVDHRIVSALAKAVMVMIAILLLTAAILTLNEMQDSRKRILVAAFFAQLFALPIQFLGSRALPLYMLVIA